MDSSSTVSFTLAEGMHVKLSVINVKGQVVEVLVNGYRAAGKNRKTFKAPNVLPKEILSPGV